MSDATRFPRLSVRGVKALLEDLEATTQLSWQERNNKVTASVTMAPTGGSRVSDHRLEEIRARLVEIAVAHGFPDGAGARRVDFDKRVAITLIDENLIPAPEALRDDVWAFTATVLLADVVFWRWGQTAERYRGGIRNAFQRLWLRAAALRRDAVKDRWELVETLSEDANLQILERPSVSASRKVTRVIGEVWLEMSRENPMPPMEEITRKALRHLLALEQVRPLHALDDDDLHAEIRQHFDQTRALI